MVTDLDIVGVRDPDSPVQVPSSKRNVMQNTGCPAYCWNDLLPCAG